MEENDDLVKHCDFRTLAIASGEVGWKLNVFYSTNRIFRSYYEEAGDSFEVRPVQEESVDLLNRLAEQAKKKNGLVTDVTADRRNISEAQLMDFLTPPPSSCQCFFAQHYSKKSRRSNGLFYQLSRNNDYIKTSSHAKISCILIRLNTETWKSRSIYLNLKKIQNTKICCRKRCTSITHRMLCMEK